MIAVVIAMPAGRTVLRDSPLGHMNMNVARLIEAGVDAERLGMLANIADGSLGRFLHHIAEVAGQLQISGPLHRKHLNPQQFAAKRGPCESVDNADFILRIDAVLQKLLRSEQFHNGVLIHMVRFMPLETTSRATLRQTEAISRSKLRTPDSLV